MRIAVACEGSKVTMHFGHCENFTFFDVESGVVTKKESFANPGHRPGFLPKFVAEKGANVIIAGGMGGGAVELFQEAGIDVVVGATGDAQDVVQAYVSGVLVSTGSICHEHEHEGSCNS